MPDQSTRHALNKAIGNEFFTRAAFLELIDEIDAAIPTDAEIEAMVDGPIATHAAATTSVHGIPDTALLARLNASTPFTVEQFIERAGATDPALSARVAGDANPRVQVRPDGILFGPGGASALDILFRRMSSTAMGVRTAADAAYRDMIVSSIRAAIVEHQSDGSRNLRWGTGSPEGVVTASVGSEFLRTDGAAGTVLYVKETGTGNTGWKSYGAPSHSVLSRVTSLTGPINTTAETNLFSYSVPGGTLGTNGLLRLHLAGSFLQYTGAWSPVTIRVYWGGTLYTYFNAGNVSSQEAAWEMDVTLAATGATNSQFLDWSAKLTDPFNGVDRSGLVNAAADWKGNDRPTKDSTVAQALTVTAQFDVAGASTYFRADYALLERIA